MNITLIEAVPQALVFDSICKGREHCRSIKQLMSLNEHPLPALRRAHSSWGAVVGRDVPDPGQVLPGPQQEHGLQAALLAARSSLTPAQSAWFLGMLLDTFAAVR